MRVFTQLMMRIKEIYAIIKGTPTESPTGVFGGFTDSNYLVIERQLPTNATEFQCEFTMQSTIPTSGTQTIFMCGLFSLTLYSKAISMYSGGYKNIIPSSDVVADSNYVVKCVINGKSLSFSYSKDGGAFVSSLSITTTNNYSATMLFGKSTSSGRSFKGTVNVANTYIKIGDKYWYNGLYK